MTHDELIIVARTHTIDIPKLSGEPWATLEALPKITVMDAVVVSFESDQRHGKMFVVFGERFGKVRCFAVALPEEVYGSLMRAVDWQSEWKTYR